MTSNALHELDELTARIDALLAHVDPATTDPVRFLRAQFDAGLAWVGRPTGRGGLDLDPRLQEFVERAEIFPTPAAIRRAIELRGKKCGQPLVPLSPESAKEMEQFANWFTAWLPLIRKVAANA